METNRTEDFPSHWKATLLGEAFWKDAERFNQPINDSIEANRSSALHLQLSFPFNLTPARRPPIEDVAKEVEVEKKQRRRFSMSDVLNLNSFSNARSSFSQSRFFDLGKSSRSRSQSRSPTRAPSISSETRRRRFRNPFNMASSKRNEKIESVLATPIPQEPGTPARPLIYFRGGATWNHLPKDLTALGIDVFWPVKEGQDVEEGMLKIEEMAPLCQFRNLRTLKITGMMQSYQRYIWQAAWLNTELEELELGMALEPRIRRSASKRWPYIKGGWRLDEAHHSEPVYYGHAGDGTLDPKIGAGEYLDKTAIEKAKVRAMVMGRTLNRLSIKTLTLTGFVVDADPFIHWFDPKHLKCINFKDFCVDAGFYLPWPMRKVAIHYPLDVSTEPVPARRIDPLRELKVIELKGGKKVGEMPFRGSESLKQPPLRNLFWRKTSVKKRETDGEMYQGRMVNHH
ncbi:hypothetical protein KXV68_008835 [Aspergillus fumigatus]|nr:hypothetical protein CNMCM8714_005610 [Aspergillus fumigatus]KAF4270964.1 hypothetical protein CNMCM8057_007522 [Aspergillus fumigatus]KAF4275460.1 hypothetical protein CNMCM8812_001431 [Aspergillus fumigatus]KAH1306854.1 hypothetical protein KXX11_005833 [Aspergillus fumigatus]KAH1342316.1 hypothetical protein KXX67_006607 [Aspergillus fumigatus]